MTTPRRPRLPLDQDAATPSFVLERRLRRADPSARLMIEAHRIVRGDVKRRKEQFDAADALTGLEVLSPPRYGVTLAGTPGTIVSHAVAGDGYITDLDTTSPYICCRALFAGVALLPRIWRRVIAKLHPANGGAKNVEKWRCELYLATADPPATMEWVALGTAVDVVAGPSEADVTFDFQEQGLVPAQVAAQLGVLEPRIYIVIKALKSDSSAATNVGWRRDSTTASVTNNGVTITTRGVTVAADGKISDEDVSGTPIITIDAQSSFAESILAFTGTNKPDLGGVPASASNVVFVVQGERPNGTKIKGEARVGGADAWVEVKDGQTAADVGLAVSQTYQMRATLSPTAALDVAPVLTDLGIQEVTRTDLSHIASVSGGGWGFDPVTLKGHIPEVTITAIQDGERDFRDQITDLFSTTDIGDLWFRIYVADDGLARHLWYHVDDFYPDHVEGVGGALVIRAVNVLGLLKQALPKYDAVNQKREKLSYANQTLKAAYSDLLKNQIALKDRHIGPMVEAQRQLVTKEITDSEGKVELDAITFLAGGSVQGWQGKVGFVDVHGSKGAILFLGIEDIAQDTVTPGWSQAVPTFFADYNYNFAAGKFRGQHRAINQLAFDKLGQRAIDRVEFTDDEIAKWIPASGSLLTISSLIRDGSIVTATTSSAHSYVSGDFVEIAGANETGYNGVFQIEVTSSTQFIYTISGTPTTPATGTITVTQHLAASVTGRQITTLGTGMITLDFRTVDAYPELWPGDMVAVRTDRLVAKSPTDGRAIKGYTWVLGVIAERRDVWGTDWRLWVRRYSDILASSNSVTVGDTLQTDLFTGASFRSESATTAGSVAAYEYRNRVLALPAGLWRTVLYDNDTWRLQRNTAAGGDFSTLEELISVGASEALSLNRALTVSALLTAQAGLTVSGGAAIIGADPGSGRLRVGPSASQYGILIRAAAAPVENIFRIEDSAGQYRLRFDQFFDFFVTSAAGVDVARISAAGLGTFAGGLTVSGGSISASGISATVGALTATTIEASGRIRNTSSANPSPFTQARITLYDDGTNWGYFGYGSDAFMRIVFSQTAIPQRLLFGTSSATDGTGTFSEVMRLTTAALSPATAGLLTLGSTALPWKNPSFGFDASNRLDITISSAGAVTYDAVGSGALHTFSDDVTIGSLGRFDSADTPTDLQLLVYHTSVSKWQAESIQFVRGSGDFKAALLADNTAAAYVLLDPGAGADGAQNDPSTPTVTVGHNSFVLEIPSGYTKAATFRYFEWQVCTGTDCVGFGALVNSTSRSIVHSRLTAATVYRYRVRAVSRGGTVSNFATTGNNTAAAQSDVQAFGGIIAGELATVDLTALAGDIGIVITGQVRDLATNPLSVINFGGVGGGIPSTAVSVINFENTSIPSGSKMIVDFYGRLISIKDEQASPITRVEIGEISTGTSDWGIRLRGAAGNSIADLWGANLLFQNDAASPAQGVLIAGSRPAGWKTYLDLVNNLFTVNDATYDRVKTGLIGSYYGMQFRDSAGNLSLDTANSDGRLKLQVGKSTTLAPPSLFLYENRDLSTTSTSDVSLASYTLLANALATNGDSLRISIEGSFSAGNASNNVYVKFGATNVSGSISESTITKFKAEVKVVRTGASAQKAKSWIHEQRASMTVETLATSPAENTAANITIDFRGVVGSGITLTIDQVLVEYLSL